VESPDGARIPKTVSEARAIARAQEVEPAIQALQAIGRVSLRAIANGLNEKNIPTVGGRSKWSEVQVARVLERLASVSKS
jgi:hypothetical protein